MVGNLVMRTTAVWFAIVVALFAGQAQAQSVRVSVNGTQITDQQISDRANLLRIEGRGQTNSARTSAAREELIDEAIKMQEARRLGINVSSSQVDAAYANIAQNMRVSSSNLNQILQQNGVNAQSLRNRLQAAIGWQNIVQSVLSQRVQVSELELDLRAAQEVKETTSFDYILKEVIFVIPKGSGVSASRRTAEANQYRSRFKGCDTAVDVVLNFNDAAVMDIGRRHATQLPDAVGRELASMTVGQITKPRTTEAGVSMYAICEKASARDLTFLKDDLRQEVGTEQLVSQADQYLKELRSKATITTR